MPISLVTAPTVTEFSDAEEIRSRAVTRAARDPQLGILSLAAVLEARGEDIRVVDLNSFYMESWAAADRAEAHDFADIAARGIAQVESEVYGLSSICSSYPLTIRIAKALKAFRPNCMVLLGGPQASVVDILTLEAFPFIDLILRGEAEQTLPLLLEQLHGNRRFETVPGLTFRSGSDVKRNPNASVIEDLDALPSPAYHLTDYLSGADKADLELGRGCPFSCTFCSTNDFFRRRFRLRSPERVLRDMRKINLQYSIRDFELIHDMFTVDRRRVAEFCQAMIGAGEAYTWSCSARTDCIDEELLELMAKAGCRGIFYGVEVGSAKMQKVIDKHLDMHRVHEIIDATERQNIRSTVSLISGFPEETWGDIRDTLDVYMHSARCPQSHPQLNLLAPLAETPLCSKYEETLILEELCSDMSHQSCTQNPADQELIRAHVRIFANFYMIPTPNLDRDVLRELWEFILMATARFRWILVGIDQSCFGILGLFTTWREHRLRVCPNLQPSELRRYYRTDDFRADFSEFLATQDVSKTPAVRLLLQYEKSIRDKARAHNRKVRHGDPLPLDVAMSPSDIPIRRDRVVVFELHGDLQAVINGLKDRKDPVLAPGRRYYVARPVTAASARIDGVSDWVAHLLRLCNGRRCIKAIVQQMSVKLADVQPLLRQQVCTQLLEGIRAQSLIEIYRKADARKPTASSPGRYGFSAAPQRRSMDK
jgi:radical SAM superfamily enzyme YgiQ (UPF0313 family)